jgi:hypothetical protein
MRRILLNRSVQYLPSPTCREGGGGMISELSASEEALAGETMAVKCEADASETLQAHYLQLNLVLVYFYFHFIYL